MTEPDRVRVAFDALVAACDASMVGVTVAAPDGDDVDGCLVGFHSQCSIDPPRYAVWLSVENRTYRIARRATHLAVHRLTVDQHALAEHLGGVTGDEVDKLPKGTWHAGPGGVPLLHAAPDRFVGEIVERVEVGGDHVAFVLAPVEATMPRTHVPSLRLGQVLDIDPGHDP